MASNVTIKSDPEDVCERILSLCRENGQGIGDKVLQTEMPDVDPKSRAKAINQVGYLQQVQRMSISSTHPM